MKREDEIIPLAKDLVKRSRRSKIDQIRESYLSSYMWLNSKSSCLSMNYRTLPEDFWMSIPHSLKPTSVPFQPIIITLKQVIFWSDGKWHGALSFNVVVICD